MEKFAKNSSLTPVQHIYIVGRKRPIFISNILSTFKNVEFIQWQGFSEENVSSLIKQMGNIEHKSYCLLALDILCLTTKTFSLNCRSLACQEPICVMTLATGEKDIDEVMATGKEDIDEVVITSYLQSKMIEVMTFITKLTEYFSVIILPLFPVKKLYWEALSHYVSHLVYKTDDIVSGKVNWNCFDKVAHKLWGSFIKSNNENYFVPEELQKLITEMCNDSLVSKKFIDGPSVCQISSWRHILEVFLKFLTGESSGMKYSTTLSHNDSSIAIKGDAPESMQPNPSLVRESLSGHWQSQSSPPWLPSQEFISRSEHTNLDNKRSRSRSGSVYRDYRFRTRYSWNCSHSGEAREHSLTYNQEKISPSRPNGGSGSGRSPIPRFRKSRSRSICSSRRKRQRLRSTRSRSVSIRRSRFKSRDRKCRSKSRSSSSSCSPLSVSRPISRIRSRSRSKLRLRNSRSSSIYGPGNRRKRRRSRSNTRSMSLSNRSRFKFRNRKSRSKLRSLNPSSYRNDRHLSESNGSVSNFQEILQTNCENKSLSGHFHSKFRSERNGELQFSNSPLLSTTVGISHEGCRSSSSHNLAAFASGGFSLQGTIALLEQIQSKLGVFGPAVMAIVNLAKQYGINSKRTMNIFTDKDNIYVLQIVVDKLRVKTKFEPSADTPLFTKAVDRILQLIEIAKFLTESSAMNSFDI